jgi:elongation factor G
MVASWVAPLTSDGRTAAPKSNEEQRFAVAVGRILALDPSLWVDAEGVEVGRVVHAANDAQLTWFVDRLAEWFGVKCRRELAPVPYREYPTMPVTEIEGVHRVEDATGCATAYGRVVLDLEPAPLEVGRLAIGVEVENYLSEDDVPPELQPDAIAGVRRGLARGPRGYPVAGAVVRLVGGEHDLLASTGDHFAKAGEAAARLAADRAQTRLAEPWVDVVVWVPPANTGEILAEIGARRGRISGLEIAGSEAAIHAVVPYRELRTFGPRVQGQTGGRGRFVAGTWHWEPLPANLCDDRGGSR